MANRAFQFPRQLHAALGEAAVRGLSALPADDLARLDLEAAQAIDLDADGHSEGDPPPTFARYLGAFASAGISETDLSHGFDAALDAAVSAALGRDAADDVLARASELAAAHPSLRDQILCAALGLGLPETSQGAVAGLLPADLPLGALLFGRWRVERELGIGATSRTVVAVDEVLSMDARAVRVVVKRYDDGVAEARSHALREIRALSAAPAGLVPQPLALHAPPGQPAFLVTRYEESRSPNCADDIARLAEALARLHSAGIAHGDIKPEHARIRPNRTAFFIDFGMSGPSTPDAVHADLARLTEVAKPLVPAAVHGIASRLLRRGRTRLAAASLCITAPEALRRAARHAAVFLLLATGTLLAGYAFGRWIVPQRAQRGSSIVATATPDVIDTLSQSGRFEGLTVRKDGTIADLWLRLPELVPQHSPGGPWKQPALRFLRLNRDGSISYQRADSDEIVSPPPRLGQ